MRARYRVALRGFSGFERSALGSYFRLSAERRPVYEQVPTLEMADFVVADANGVIFLPEDRLGDIIAAAIAYRETEGRQLEALRAGRSYRSQVRFDDYLARRHKDGGYGFRQHLKDIEAAGEV